MQIFCMAVIYFLFKGQNPKYELKLVQRSIVEKVEKYYAVPYFRYLTTLGLQNNIKIDFSES